jgi:ribosomal protein S3
VIGVKCWVYKGEILPGGPRRLRNEPEPRRSASAAGSRSRS